MSIFVFLSNFTQKLLPEICQVGFA